MGEHYGHHLPPTPERIRELARAGAVFVTEHAAEQLLGRYITADRLQATLEHAIEIIDDYPGDPRGHTCLAECTDRLGNTLHCVCAVVEAEDIFVGKYGITTNEGLVLIVVTVYEP